MEIPGWAYLTIGIIVSGSSGYFYKYVPKPDGSPNMSMALFFFIGIIFIIVGVTKMLMKKMDEKQQQIEAHNLNAIHTAKQPHHTAQQHQATAQQKAPHHTSQYAQQHPYQQTAVQQPTHQVHHQQHQATQHTTVHHTQPTHQQHTPQIINCPRCTTHNYTYSNYCHNCGFNLRG